MFMGFLYGHIPSVLLGICLGVKLRNQTVTLLLASFEEITNHFPKRLYCFIILSDVSPFFFTNPFPLWVLKNDYDSHRSGCNLSVILLSFGLSFLNG